MSNSVLPLWVFGWSHVLLGIWAWEVCCLQTPMYLREVSGSFLQSHISAWVHWQLLEIKSILAGQSLLFFLLWVVVNRIPMFMFLMYPLDYWIPSLTCWLNQGLAFNFLVLQFYSCKMNLGWQVETNQNWRCWASWENIMYRWILLGIFLISSREK